MKIAIINTPLGFAKIEGDANGISKIHILSEVTQITAKIPKELEETVVQINDYFKGNRTIFNLKLNPIGTEFQKKIWQELLQIPYGKTCSYLELSKKIGDVKAIRAVAAANGKNPLWIIIPCHRVIGANGSLTGYAGGLWRKNGC